ncbi:hypothetical protein SOVF_212830 [Spinacia oleracea]|uniref:Protein IQ-DOMAIN 1 n=1 Tax=Spinacia oleracea TaxID=3562 RepID=A0A9R0IBD9_SPIOL|nr:protein IQ-DOMAIN 9 [Spinacia oleracea]XP_021846019.1 protein IQ-DOMAIN 9 [Spinacia oleracea]KNA03054.1 hypothetical protein SOVF_212830 [Spinacia oleracea]
MGSGDWFKTKIFRKKAKLDKSKKSKGSSASDNQGEKNNANGGRVNRKTNGALVKLSEDVAATKIQTAFRAYAARKALRRMKGIIRFQKLTQFQSVKKQSTNTLNSLHLWSTIQTQIRDRRQCMVIEGRLKQKRLENQIKLEAKLHDLEVEWNGGADTMEDILSRIHQREEAAVKRERTLAYAFSHQWRANSSQNQGSDASELGKADWGWSWKERWIAARPWESRLSSESTGPKKGQNKLTSKARKSSNSTSTKKSFPSKTAVLNGKAPGKPRRVSFPGAEKATKQEAITKVQENKRESLS